MKRIDSILDCVGNTPIVCLNEAPGKVGSRFSNFEALVFAKLEFRNPSGSIKDRVSKFLIEEAEHKGMLKPGYTIVEATSGNMGISLAMMAAVKGYKFIAVMPDNETEERVRFMQGYGAEVVLSPADKLVEGAVQKAKEIAQEPNHWMPSQFSNPSNVICHKETTGKELIQQIGEKVDVFVAGVGTGGTLMGVGRALREINPNVKLVSAQPSGSRELTGGKPGHHSIGGVADGFIPEIVDTKLINEVVYVEDAQAIEMCRILSREKGLFVGPSSGANAFVALRMARKLKKGNIVATVLPDGAERYFSIGIVDKDADKVKVPHGCMK